MARFVFFSVVVVTVLLSNHRLHGQIPEVRYNLLEVTTAKAALRTLQQPKRFVWDGQPLRGGIATLAKASQLNNWIDRRIDPGQPVTYTPPVAAQDSNGPPAWREVSLLGRLESVAREVSAEVGVIENVVYFGPIGETRKIQSSAVRLHNAITNQDAQLGNEARLLKWSELATPRVLLDEIEKQWGIRVEGELPHDLLHAGELLVPSTLATQLTIVAGGFDMEVQLVGERQFRLLPLSPEVRWRANYAKSSLEPSAYSQLRRKYAGSQMQCRANSCSLVGATSFHIAMFAKQIANPAGGNAALRRWSFEVDPAPTDLILEKVAATIGVALKWDPACTDIHRRKLQSLKLDKVTTEVLLNRVCSGAELDYTLEEGELLVRPRSP